MPQTNTGKMAPLVGPVTPGDTPKALQVPRRFVNHNAMQKRDPRSLATDRIYNDQAPEQNNANAQQKGGTNQRVNNETGCKRHRSLVIKEQP
jgi:hypothetical protein